MTPVEFCYWLQGYFELADNEDTVPAKGERKLSGLQVECIQNHLALVFKHEIDPSYTSHVPEDQSAEIQKQLQELHDGVKEAKKIASSAGKAAYKTQQGPIKYRC